MCYILFEEQLLFASWITAFVLWASDLMSLETSLTKQITQYVETILFHVGVSKYI